LQKPYVEKNRAILLRAEHHNIFDEMANRQGKKEKVFFSQKASKSYRVEVSRKSYELKR